MSLERHVGMLRGSADQGCELNAVVRNGEKTCEKMSNSSLSHYKEICVLVCSGRRNIDAQEAMKDDERRICGCIPCGLIIQTCKFDRIMYAMCRRGSMKTYRKSWKYLMLLHAHNELKGLITGSADYSLDTRRMLVLGCNYLFRLLICLLLSRNICMASGFELLLE